MLFTALCARSRLGTLMFDQPEEARTCFGFNESQRATQWDEIKALKAKYDPNNMLRSMDFNQMNLINASAIIAQEPVVATSVLEVVTSAPGYIGLLAGTASWYICECK